MRFIFHREMYSSNYALHQTAKPLRDLASLAGARRRLTQTLGVIDMSDIERILKTGRSARDEEVQTVTAQELRALETELGFSFPNSYREFVALGGLGELRINHSILSPQEIVESLGYVDSIQYVPFADNGCGDLYCWTRTEQDEPEVVFFDHETEEASADANSFVEWLTKNRF